MKYDLKLVDKNDPILNSVISRFDFENDDFDPVEIAKNLAESMIVNNGLGISANQIGLEHRAFAINAEKIIVCFNPIIVDSSSEEILLEEGCLSHPNLFVKVKRPKRIKVRYAEPSGEVVTKTFDGMTARIFQHELDHLNGICHISRATKFHLEQALRHKKKLDRGGSLKKRSITSKTKEILSATVA